ncbi:hypothetical protein Fmac_001870 [Flemingia macrophylla]|uniref:Uncharacterized protein n=1 Tax=Flemingia macrophylla TaxID=520843 RepID=A0ABD1NL46_9FABA
MERTKRKVVWPRFAKHKMNEFLLLHNVKVTLRPNAYKNELVERNEINDVVKCFMEGKKGKKLHHQMKDLKKILFKVPTLRNCDAQSKIAIVTHLALRCGRGPHSCTIYSSVFYLTYSGKWLSAQAPSPRSESGYVSLQLVDEANASLDAKGRMGEFESGVGRRCTLVQPLGTFPPTRTPPAPEKKRRNKNKGSHSSKSKHSTLEEAVDATKKEKLATSNVRPIFTLPLLTKLVAQSFMSLFTKPKEVLSQKINADARRNTYAIHVGEPTRELVETKCKLAKTEKALKE